MNDLLLVSYAVGQLWSEAHGLEGVERAILVSHQFRANNTEWPSSRDWILHVRSAPVEASRTSMFLLQVRPASVVVFNRFGGCSSMELDGTKNRKGYLDRTAMCTYLCGVGGAGHWATRRAPASPIS